VARLGEPELQHGRHARRDLHLLEPARIQPEEVLGAAVRGQAHRPGVRHAHGDAVEVHRQPHAQALDHLAHGRREALPLHIGLLPAQQQERGARRVVQQVEVDRGGLVGGPPVAVEDHRGPPGPVVHQPVRVEARQQQPPVVLQQMGHDLGPGLAGVHEALEEVQQYRPGRLAADRAEGGLDGLQGLRLKCVQRLRIKHSEPNLPRSARRCGRTTLSSTSIPDQRFIPETGSPSTGVRRLGRGAG